MRPATNHLISAASRKLLFASAWLVAIAIGCVITFPWFSTPVLPLLIPYFPLGLLKFLNYPMMSRTPNHFVIILCWLPFIALTVAALRTPRRPVFYSLLAIFCVLMLLNLAGCKMIMAGPGPVL